MIDDFKPYIDRLKNSGLRPTKQRLAICKILFGNTGTFHFTIENLKKIVEKKYKNKISLATLYNTVHALKKNNYLKEVNLKSDKIFYDTNTENHHHFYDEDVKKLFDIKKDDILISKLPEAPNGKKISAIEVTVKLVSDNHNQKKYN